MTIVSPVMVSVRHKGSTVSAQPSLSAGFFGDGMAPFRVASAGRG